MSADDDNLPERWCRPLSITIDGPAGSGKSTVARLVAESLGYQYIDTGATYRALAWLALDRGIPLDDPARLRGLALAQPAAQYHADGSWHVRIAGVDVSDRVREPAVGDAASKVARHDLVREVLVQQQRDIAGARDAVFDGRDAGTRIVPHADLKLYVTASFDERARRRCDQVGATGKERRAIEQAMRARDERDAPQSAIAEDALTVDTTDMGIDEVVDHIVNMWIDRRSDLLGAETIAGRDADSWIEGEARDGFQRLYRRLSPLYRAIFRVEYHGLDRIPEGGCLVVANHASMWDPGFIMKPMNEPVRYMSKLENTTLPIYNRMLDTTGSFPVRRGGGDRVAMHIAEMVLRRGDKLGVFPEGTRIYGEGLGQPRKGAARLALVAGVPVLPVAIYGNRYADTAFKVRVAFGTPLDFNHLRATPGNVTNATLEAWDHVTELWRALRQGSIS